MAPLADLPDHHDLPHLRAALEHVKQFRCAVEGGAHRGIWTRVLGEWFRKVVAFEPVPELAFQVTGASQMFVAALGNVTRQVGFQAGHQNTGQGHVSLDREMMVQMYRLDDFGLEEVDFLKLDVEGYELPALIGAQDLIARCRPAILVEQNRLSERYGYTDAELGVWMSDHEYRHEAQWNKDHLYLPA